MLRPHSGVGGKGEDAQRMSKEIWKTTEPTSNQIPKVPKSCSKASLGSNRP